MEDLKTTDQINLGNADFIGVYCSLARTDMWASGNTPVVLLADQQNDRLGDPLRLLPEATPLG